MLKELVSVHQRNANGFLLQTVYGLLTSNSISTFSDMSGHELASQLSIKMC